MKSKLIHPVLMTCALLLAGCGKSSSPAQTASPSAPSVSRSKAAATGATEAPNLSALKYGLYIHFGIATFTHPGEQGQIPAERFAPTALDVKAWARAAKEAGMTFAVLTAKHESGFCLWDSADYPYDTAPSPFKGDIIGDFITACDAEGILPGVHYSIPDALNEGAVRFKGPVSPPYFAVIKKHLTELHAKYPGLRIQVLDAIERLSPDQFVEISQLIKRLNPGCVLFNGGRPGDSGLRQDSDTIIKGWMWKPQAQLNPAQNLFDHYSRAQLAGHVFLLNVGPDPSGRIPDDQMALLRQVKEMIATRPLTPPRASTQPATRPPAADRLKQAKDLYDQGLINKDVYDRKVKEILDSL
jgi:alpha-L-fucosidase